MSEGWGEEGIERGPHRQGLYPIRTVSRLTGVPAALPTSLGAAPLYHQPYPYRQGPSAPIPRGRMWTASARSWRSWSGGWPSVKRESSRNQSSAWSPPGRARRDCAAPGPGARAGLGPDRGPLAWLLLEGMLAGARQFDTVALDIIYNDALSSCSIDPGLPSTSARCWSTWAPSGPTRRPASTRERCWREFLRNKLQVLRSTLNTLSQGPRLVAPAWPGKMLDLGLLPRVRPGRTPLARAIAW